MERVDYNEIFVSVVKYVFIRILLLFVVNFDIELEKMDVKIVFLYGSLDEIIYME